MWDGVGAREWCKKRRASTRYHEAQWEGDTRPRDPTAAVRGSVVTRWSEASPTDW